MYPHDPGSKTDRCPHARQEPVEQQDYLSALREFLLCLFDHFSWENLAKKRSREKSKQDVPFEFADPIQDHDTGRASNDRTRVNDKHIKMVLPG